jgi:cell division protein FtsQ
VKQAPPRNTKRPHAEPRELPGEPASDTRDEVSPPPPSTVHSVRPPPEKPARPGRVRRVLSSLWAGARVVLGVAIVVAASIGAAWGAKSYVTKSPRFVVKTITVEGASRLSPDAIAKAGGVGVGMNVFTIDVEQVKRALEKEPYVAEATVARKLPNTIAIKVVERQPAALVGLGSDLYVATHEGDVFKQLGPEDPSDLPVVTGIRPEMAVDDRQGLAILVRRALDVVDEAEKCGLAKRYPVQEIHIERDGTVEAIVGREGISIHLGNPPFKGKLEQAEKVLTEVQRRKSNAEVVFLDNDANPDRVVVRMR